MYLDEAYDYYMLGNVYDVVLWRRFKDRNTGLTVEMQFDFGLRA